MRLIASNTLLLSSAHILNPLTSILLVSAIARLHGAETLGKYSLVLTLFYMAVAVAGLGLNTPITRAVSSCKEKASDFFVVVSIIGFTTSLLTVGGISLIVALLGYSREIHELVSIISWAIIPAVLISLYEAIFLAFHKAKIIAVISIVENVCKVVVGFILLALNKDIQTLFLLIVYLRVAAFIAFLLCFRIVIMKIVFHFNWRVLKELCKVSPVFTGNLLIEALFGRVDVLILSKMASVTDVGYYSAALRFVEIAKLLPISFIRAAFPAMCETLHSAQDSFKQLFSNSVTYMVIYGVGASIAFVFFAGFLIALFYGDSFSNSESLLKILAFLLIPASLSSVMAATLFSGHHELLDFFANIVKISLLIFLCVVLIPHWAGMGSAIALITAESTLLVLLALFVRSRMFEFNLLHGLMRPSLAALVTYLISLYIPEQPVLFYGSLLLLCYALLTLIFLPDVRKDVLRVVHLAYEKLNSTVPLTYNKKK